MALLSFSSVSKRYAKGRANVVALDGVSFDIDPGDFIGIYGARRSGKSTLLRLAAGLELPDSGAVEFEGDDVARMSRRARARLLGNRIGRASTERPPIRNERVVDYVATPLLFCGASHTEANIQARRTLARVDASDCADVLTLELSPGEQTLVAIARALVRDPSLLLVDEPVITPSPSERDKMKGLLRGLAGEPALTVIIASADMSAVRIARRVWTISDGSVRTTDRLGRLVPFPGRADGIDQAEHH
jgi:ABC-type lipoprotein export system ATPase subunit